MADNYNVRDSAGTAFAKGAKDVSSVWFDKVVLADGTNLARIDDCDSAVDERLDSYLATIAGLMALDTGASAGSQLCPLKIESAAQPNLRVAHWNAGVAMPAGASATTPIFVTEVTNAANGATSLVVNDCNGTAQAIKASAGTLYELNVYNTSGATAFVHVYNTAFGSVTVGTTVPLRTYVIATATFTQFLVPAVGIVAGTALSIGSATTLTGAVGSSNGVKAWVSYK